MQLDSLFVLFYALRLWQALKANFPFLHNGEVVKTDALTSSLYKFSAL